MTLHAESSEEWGRHLASITADGAPEGDFEALLVERIALALWRLRRVANFEVASVVQDLEEKPNKAAIEQVEAEEAHEAAYADLLQTIFDLPPDQEVSVRIGNEILEYIWLVMLERGPQMRFQPEPAPLTAGRVIERARELIGAERDELFEFMEPLQAAAESRLREMRDTNAFVAAELREDCREARVLRALSDAPSLYAFMRYGAYLERSLNRTLSELLRVQSLRLAKRGAGPPI